MAHTNYRQLKTARGTMMPPHSLGGSTGLTSIRIFCRVPISLKCDHSVYAWYVIISCTFHRNPFSSRDAKHGHASSSTAIYVDRPMSPLTGPSSLLCFHDHDAKSYYLAIQRSVWRDIKFAVFFVCTVEDISTQDGAIGVKF